MTKSTLPAMDTKEINTSLTSKLVRTIFFVAFILLAGLIGLIYFRTRALLLEINSPTASAQVTELTLFTVLVSLGVFGVLYALLNWGVSRFVQPLQSLADSARRFTDGDWTQRVEISTNDEVGVIANSFNHMAGQLGEVYQSLEKKVDERARQIRTAAEVAQNVTTTLNLDDMLNKTTELLVQEFGFYQASVFLIDRGGKYADFKSGSGPATKELINKKYRLEVGSASIIGWVAAKNQARITSNVSEDPLHLRNELLPETKSEATVPISLGNLVLGVLDVQSTQAAEFSPDTVVMLQTLASQIAAAIQTTGLIEASQINFQEMERLYRSSRLIAEANSEFEILNVGGQILRNAPYPIVMFRVEKDLLRVIASADTTRNLTEIEGLPTPIKAQPEEIYDYLLRGAANSNLIDSHTPKVFKDLIHNLDLIGAVFIPVRKGNHIVAIMMIGSRQQTLSNTSIQPYINLADLMSVALERADAVKETSKHLHEVEALASINDLISSASDMQSFYQNLLAKIKQIIGDYNLIVALYDEKTNSINIPFSYENGQVISIDSFPLGEGLTSILIRTRQPLMIVEDTERKLAQLGAKITGKPAKSWMGAPMLVHNNPIGALIIQDLDREQVFTEEDLKFFTTLAGQVANVIYNAALLDESQRRALQLETAAEIARDISGSLDLDELLVKAVGLIRQRFNFYHAAIFLLDLPGEFAVIREATGEAGAQMKRAGHKIGVGSKSIVGFVTGRGEPLVVNDTSKDATYYANPLLPDTRAEAAIPLRVGDRILGALDVQSTKPYSFSEDNLRSLQILADQLAVAVANTELFAETQEHLSQHRLLHHITSTAASGTTLEEALESAVKGLQVTLGGDRVTILLLDRERKMLEVKAAVGYAEDVAVTSVEVGKGVTGWVAAHKRPLRIRDVSEDPRYIQFSPNTRSELAIPLIYRSEVLGVLNVESEQVDAYTENDEEMLGTLGGSLAAVIANARLLEQIRAQSERERLVYDITSKIRRSTDIQSILMTTASEITKVTGARFTKIEMKPSKNGESKEAE
jgi:GAF domain-containing protein/HAMP domain-containing protein